MNQNLAAIGIFSFSVLLLTRLDFLINNIFYRFGLIFSEGWYQEYTILYFLAYQLVILVLLAYTRKLNLFLFFEVFVLTSTQDLVYFILWQGSFPAHESVWMVQYRIFGFWNTTTQLLLSTSRIALITILFQSTRIPVWIRTRSLAKTFSIKMQRYFNAKPTEEL